MDATYTGDFGNSSYKFISGTYSRTFDYIRNRPVINTVNFSVNKVDTGELGYHIELNVGNDANVTAPYPWIPPQPPGIAAYGNKGVDPTQAYFDYQTPNGTWTFYGGRFPTLVGAEVIRSPDDFEISRSLLFGFAEPLTHTGVRINYAYNGHLNATVGVNNGWDQISDPVTSKSYESQLAYSNANYNIAATYLFGNEPASGKYYVCNPVPLALNGNCQSQGFYAFSDPNHGTRQLFDVVAQYHPTAKITVQANYDLGTQGNAYQYDSGGNFLGYGGVSWSGLAVYLNYALSPLWSFSARGEYYNDNNGYNTGVAQTLTEGTFTAQYTFTPKSILRAEYRFDNSNQSVFVPQTCTVLVGCSPFKNQSTLGLEVIQRF